MTGVSTLLSDAQGSVRAVTTATGIRSDRSLYSPFGEENTTIYDPATAPETKGYIGE